MGIGARHIERFRLCAATVDVWHAPTVADERAYRTALSLLSHEEWRHVTDTSAWPIRAQRATARALARTVLCDQLGMDPRQIPIRLGSHGRPVLSAATAPAVRGWDFNLSHCDEHVVLALAHGVQVGIDIVRIVARSGAAALAQRYFSPGERAAIDIASTVDLNAGLLEWHRVWSRREAHAKALGVGVRVIGAPLDTDESRCEDATSAALPGYALCVAARRPRGSTGDMVPVSMENA